MKIKEGYVLRSVADQHLVVPTGEEGVNFNGIITLNDSGKLLFERLKKGAEPKALVALLMETYDVSKETANEDVKAFIETLKSKNIIVL